MQKSISESKTILREQVRAILKRLNVEGRRSASAAACELLQKQEVWKKVQSILFYAPLPEELDIWSLVGDAQAAGKTVALLRFDSRAEQYTVCRVEDPVGDLRTGRFGIREPHEQCLVIPLDQIDLILAPGVAFDLKGRRLGRGRGIYDRLLSRVRCLTCGVSFDEQIVPEIPVAGHDVQMNYIVSPTRWIEI